MSLSERDYTLRPKDGFHVDCKTNFTTQEQEVLQRLFLPLIGPEAVGVYTFLMQFDFAKVKSSMTHYVFMNELRMNLLQFRTCMDMLEAIGIVKTYVHHEAQHSHYIYQMLQLPSPKQFFGDPMLSVYLYQSVESARYKQLKAYFSDVAPDYTSYQDVTKKFTQVFKIPVKDVETDISGLTDTTSYQGIQVENVDFDFDMLYQLLQSHFISSKIVTKSTKALILQLATLYGLSPEAMKSLILKSITSAQNISHETLRKHARKYYLMEHEQQLPKLERRAQDDVVLPNAQQANNTNAQSHEDWLTELDHTSPIDMLASWSESEPTAQQKRMIEDLIERERLSFGVINILLQYVMLSKDEQLPRRYIEEIASNWKKKGLKTAKDAYAHAKSVQESQQNRKQTRQSAPYQHQLVSKEMTPKWLKARDDDDKNNEAEDTAVEDDAQLEQAKRDFYARLNKNWKEDES